jgi:hypothetical protein
VEFLGVFAQESAVTDHRVAVHADQPSGGPHPVAIGQMFDQVDGLVLGQAGVEQRRPLAFGEPGLAGEAVEEPMLLGLAVAASDREIAVSPLAVVGAIRVLAAETGQVVDGCASTIA